jgi:hypothetical protein
VWVSQQVADGLRPVPTFDVKAFAINDRHFAVIRVEPLSAPPCVNRGTVFERLPGASVPVKDPQRLSDLYRRSDLAHATARDAAARAAQRAWSSAGTDIRPAEQPDLQRVKLAVGVAPAASSDVAAERLFSRRFVHLLFDKLGARVGRGPLGGRGDISVFQDGLRVSGQDRR